MMPLIETLLQNEVTLERTNRDFYRLGSFTLDNEGWGGFAKWFKKSSDEEQSHADKFSDLLVDRNITPIYDTIRNIEPLEGDPLVWIKAALEAEKKTTAAIMEIYKQAHDEGEFLVTEFLQFFLEEQRNSEREVYDIQQALEATDEWRLIDENLND
jgi:ferritin